MRLFSSLAVAVVAAVAALTIISGASAAKPEPEQVAVDCGSAGSFMVTNSGKSEATFTPGHIVGGGTIIPVSFTNQVATFTDNQGNTTVESQPDVSKANVPANKTLVQCHFTVSFSGPEGSGSVSGDVTGFVVGRR